jgi:hypothetical protein
MAWHGMTWKVKAWNFKAFHGMAMEVKERHDMER